MSSNLFFENKKYISSKEAALLTSYSNDYIGQLCRAGKLDSKQVGRVWYVSEESILNYKNSPTVFDFSKNFKNTPAPVAIQNIQKKNDFANKVVNALERISKKVLSYNFSFFKKTAYVTAVLILVLGFVSVANSLFVFTNDVKKVVSVIPNILSNNFATVSEGISSSPFEMYEKISDVLNVYANDLSEKYISFGLNILDINNNLFGEVKEIAKNPPVYILKLVNGFATSEKVVVDKSLVLAGNTVSDIHAKTFAFISDSFGGVPYATTFTKDSTKKLTGAVVFSIQQEVLSPVDRAGIATYSVINNFFSTKIYSPLANLFNKKTIVIAPTPTKTSPKTPLVLARATNTNTSTTRVVERVVTEKTVFTGISSAELDLRLQDLNNRIMSKFSQLSTGNGGNITNVYQQIAQSQRIDQLTNTLINNPTIVGGTISNTSVSATSLSASSISANSASLGTTTLVNLTVTGTATSTFAGGINISSGCFSLNGVCITSGSGSGGVGAGTSGQFGYYNVDGTNLVATSSIYISTTTGNIGVGTTSPYRKFSVGGDAVVSGNLYATLLNASTGVIDTFNSTLATITGLNVTNSTTTNATTTNAFITSLVATNSTTTNAFIASLKLGTLNGPLQANNGIVSATTSVGVLYGGTGLTSAPTYGQLLLGNSLGGYTLTSTSSLGIISGIQTLNGLSTLSQTFATTSTNGGFGFTSSGSTHTLNIPTASSLSLGLLSASDWTVFNNKISSTSLSATNNLTYNSSTGVFGVSALYNIPLTASTTNWNSSYDTVTANSTNWNIAYLNRIISSTYPLQISANNISLAFGTTTTNSWSALQTFTNSSTTLASFVTASTTNLIVNGSSFNNLLGSGLLNVGNALTCATANSSTFGCLTGADYSRFNSATTTFSTGLTYNNATNAVTVNTSQNITNLSNLTSNGLVYTSGSNGTLNVTASSSIFGFTPASNARLLNTTYPILGGGDLTADRTFSLAFGTTTNNTWGGTNTFNSTLIISSLNGPLQANNGIVSATTSVGVLYGGTGLTSAPTYGQLLLGNSLGGYTLTSTSSLGIISGIQTLNGLSTLSQTFATTSTNGGFGFTSSGSTHTLNIPTASSLSLGLLSASDWTVFNNKISSTSLSATNNLTYNSSTGVFGVTSGYNIPLTASTTDWNTAYNTVTASSTDWNTAYLNRIISSTYPLQISSNNISLAFGTTTANSWSALQQFNAGASTTQLTTTGSTYLATVSGKVGIGTTSPSYALDVIGDIRTSGNLRLPVNGYALYGTGWGIQGSGNNTLNFVYGTTKMMIDGATGNVGIGTTSPGTALTLGSGQITVPNGTAALPSYSFSNSTNSGLRYTTGAIVFDVGGTDAAILSAGGIKAAGYSIANATDPLANGMALPSAGVIAWQNTYPTLDAGISRLGAGKLAIGNSTQGDYTGTLIAGNVGVGTTSPYRTLSVVGSGVFTGGDVLASTFTATSSITTPALTLSTLNGPLQANNGVVSATTSVGVLYGGTGLTSYVSGDTLYANAGGTLSRLPKSTDGLVLKLVAGFPSWQSDLTTGGGGGATAWSTSTNSMIIYPTDTSDILVLGAAGTSTTGNLFEVFGGNSLFGGNIKVNGELLVTSSTTLQNFSAVNGTTTNLAITGITSSILKTNTNGSIIGAVAGVDYLTSAITAMGPLGQTQTGATQLFATSTTGTDFTITASGNTTTWNLPTASSLNRGLLSSSDWSVFNNKISSTSLSATNNLTYNSATGVFGVTSGYNIPLTASTTNWNSSYDTVTANSANWNTAYTNRIISSTYPLQISSNNISLAFGTSTSNTWNGVQTFTNSSTTLASFTYASTTNLIVNGSSFNNLLGSGLLNVGNALTLDTTFLNTTANTYINSSTTIPKTYTANTFTGLQTFTNSSTSLASFTYASTTNLFAGTISLNGVDLQTTLNSKSSFAFPYTVNTGYNSTTSTIGFIGGGIFSTASSTFSGPFRLSALSNGSLAVYGGLVGSYATTTAGTGLSYNGTSFTVNTSQNITTLSNLTSNGIVYTSNGNGTLNTTASSSLFGFTPVTNARLINTTYPLLGGGDLTADRTFSLAFGTTTNNTWSGTNTFNSTVTLGSLNGPLQANNGVVSATTSVGVLYGGTGLSVAPTYGQLLVGNSLGGYTLTATSSLGIIGGIQSLNGLSTLAQTFATTSSNGGFGFTSTGSTHTLNIPTASSLSLGLLSSSDWTVFNNKISSTSLSATNNLTYNSSTGVFGVTAGYNIPLTASTTNWNAFYDTPSTRITAGTGLSWAGNTLNASNAFTGSGLNGYVARWTGANSLSTGVLFDNGTTAGVNVLPGSYNFAVQGTAGVNPFAVLTTAGNPLINATEAGLVGIGTTTPYASLSVNSVGNTPAFVVGSSTATSFIVAANGKVGVGTSAPDYKLSVVGDVNIDNSGLGHSSGIGSLNIHESSGSRGLYIYSQNVSYWGSISTDVGGMNIVAFQDGASELPITYTGSSHIFKTGTTYPSTETMRLSREGNLGIGTTTPLARLNVYGGNTVFQTTVNSATAFSILNSATTSVFSVATTGFGTTTLAGLNISGSATSTSNVGFNVTGGCFSIGGICVGSNSVTSATYPLQISANNISLAFGTTTNNTWSGTNTFSNTLTLSSVAINSLLSTNASGQIVATSTPTFGFFNATSTTATSTIAGGLAVGGNKFVVDYSSGFVGIGKSNPTAQLDVAGSIVSSATVYAGGIAMGGNNGIYFTGSTNYAQITGGNAFLNFGTGGVTRMRIDSAGNIGIGSTTPGYRLSVAGSGYFDGGIVTASSFVATSSITAPTLTLSSVAINSLLSTNASGQIVATSTPTFGFFNATSTTATSTIAGGLAVGSTNFVVDSTTGGVGIGTGITSATNKLIVNGGAIIGGTTNTQGSKLYVNGSGWFAGALYSQVLNAGGESVSLVAYNNSNNTGTASSLTFQALDSAFGLENYGRIGGVITNNTSGAGSGDVYFKTLRSGTLTEGMRLTSTGNIGVGSTSPFAKLSVHANNGETNGTLFNISSSTASATTSLFTVLNNGNVGIGTASPTQLLNISSGDLLVENSSGTDILLTNGTTGAVYVRNSLLSNNLSSLTLGGNFAGGTAGANVLISNPAGVRTFTSGTGMALNIVTTFSPTSGSGVLNLLQTTPTINQSGTASGISRGIYVDPTLTGAYDFRALETAGYTLNLNQSTTTLQSVLLNAFTIASTTSATVTNAFTQSITGAPIASTNVTISTSTALSILGGSVNGGGTVTNAYGLQVFAPTGATNNYAAAFMNGNVGIGISAPAGLLDVNSKLVVSSTGFGTTTLAGLNISGSATSTSNVGFNITTGCFAINGTCVGGSSFTLNGLTASTQTFSTSTTGGIGLSIISSGSNHLFSVAPTAGYTVPLTASTTNWNAFYDTPSTRITAGTGLSWAGNTLSASNAFTGSGIASYVARWTGANSLSTGVLFDNGTTAGVNVLPGSYNFAVQGTAGVNPFAVLTTAGAPLINATEAGLVGIGTTTPYASLSVNSVGNTPAFVVGSSTATSFIVDKSGNVGVGNSSPAFTFQVGSSAVNYFAFDGTPGSNVTYARRDSNSTSGNNILVLENRAVGAANNFATLQFNMNSSAGGGIEAGAIKVISGGAWNSGATRDSDMAFFTTLNQTSSEKMRITSDGLVGIGTSTPLAQLNVYGGDTLFQTTVNSATAFSILNAATTSVFSVATTGFGTTTLAGLNISGSATSTSNVGFNITTGCFAVNGTCVGSGSASLTGTTGQLAYFSGTNTAVGTSTIFISTAGNVGLGTITPSGKLNVLSTTEQLRLSYNATNYTSFTTSSGGILSLGTKGTTNFKFGSDPIAGYSNIWAGAIASPDSSNYGWQAKNDGTENWFNVATGGFMMFTINNAQTAPLMVKGTNVGMGYLSSATLPNLLSVNGNASFVGNVGIGSTTPGYKLSVAGAGYFDGGIVTASQFIATSSITAPTLTLSSVAINSLLSTDASGVITATSTPTFGFFNATSTTATSTIAGGLSILGSTGVNVLQNGYVGIGNATPYAGLHVSTGKIISSIIGTTGGAAYQSAVNHSQGFGYSGAITSYITGADTTGGLHVVAANNSATSMQQYSVIGMRYAENGSLGVTPVAVSNGMYVPGIGFAAQSNNVNGTGMTLSASLQAVVDGTVSSGVVPMSLVFNTSNTTYSALSEKMRITAAGNVGVGTTSPFAKLSVHANNGETNTTLFNISSSTASATTSLLSVLNNGYVGIGVANPVTKLQIGQGTTGTTFTSAGGMKIIGSAQSTTDEVFLNLIRDRDPGVKFSGAASFKLNSYQSINTSPASRLTIALKSSLDNTDIADVNVLTLQDNGNVGIGTTSPYANLSIWGSATGKAFEITNSASTTVLSVSNTGFGTTTLAGLNISGSATSTSNVGFNLTGGCFAVNGTCVGSGSASLTGTTGQLAYFSGTNTAVGTSTLYISTAGNVGVGTTTPIAKLSFDTSTVSSGGINFAGDTTLYRNSAGSLVTDAVFTAGTTIIAGSNAIIPTIYGGVGASANLTLESTANSTKGFVLISPLGGNVGIGTTSPIATLSVMGTSSAPTVNPFVVASSSGAQLLTVLANGNVGIGTTVPVQKLDVAGNIRSNNGGNEAENVLVGDASTNGGYPGIWFGANATNPSYSNYSFLYDSSPAVGTVLNSPVGQINLRIANSTYGVFNANGLAINNGATGPGTGVGLIVNTGKVGIGTTSPFAKLSISANNGETNGTLFNISSSTASATTSLFTVLNNGSVGVGTVSPLQKLHINGATLLENGGINGAMVTDLVFAASGVPTAYTHGISTSHSAALDSQNIMKFSLSTAANASLDVMTLLGNGNVGIGTTTPNWNLEVAGTAPYLAITDTDAGVGKKHWLVSNIDGKFSIGTSTDTYTSTSTAFSIEEGDTALGIGTTTPWRTLSVTGTVGLDGLTAGAGSGALCLSANKEVTYSAGATCTVSSARYKNNIATSTAGLSVVKMMRPVTFDYNADIGVTGEQFGFIAEEVEQIDPRLVVHDKNGLIQSVRYENYTAVLTKAVQELDLKVSDIDTRLTNLEALIASGTPQTSSVSFAGISISDVVNYFAGLGARFENGIAYLKSVFVDTLTVGSKEKPTGITLYDEVTGDAYCMKIRNGAMVSLAGTCESISTTTTATSTPITIATSTPTTTATSTPGIDTSVPVITIVGNNPAEIMVRSSYVDLGATVTDTNADGTVNDNLGLSFNVDGVDMTNIQIDTSTTTNQMATTTHTIIYSATDGAGNVGHATRIVNVINQ